MEPIELEDRDTPLPDHFPVSVLLERRPSTANAWADYSWSAVGLVTGTRHDGDGPTLVHQDKGVEQYLFGGLQVALFVDECESYYHNLMSPRPCCYVVARHPGEEDEDGEIKDHPDPFLVSMSFDEAHSYLEGDDLVFAMEIPPELYRWTEAYILTHYAPEKKTKRRLKDWRNSERREPQA